MIQFKLFLPIAFSSKKKEWNSNKKKIKKLTLILNSKVYFNFYFLNKTLLKKEKKFIKKVINDKLITSCNMPYLNKKIKAYVKTN